MTTITARFPGGEDYFIEDFSDEEAQFAYEAEYEAREICAGRIFASARTREVAALYLSGQLTREQRLGNRDIGESGPDTFGI